MRAVDASEEETESRGSASSEPSACCGGVSVHLCARACSGVHLCAHVHPCVCAHALEYACVFSGVRVCSCVLVCPRCGELWCAGRPCLNLPVYTAGCGLAGLVAESRGVPEPPDQLTFLQDPQVLSPHTTQRRRRRQTGGDLGPFWSLKVAWREGMLSSS